MRFSPVIGTMSLAILTQTKSNNLYKSAIGKLCFMLYACASLKLTPQPLNHR